MHFLLSIDEYNSKKGKNLILLPELLSTLRLSYQKKEDEMKGYYKLIAGRLALKGLISEIEADSIRPDIQVTGNARNSLAGEKPESSSPTAEEQ